jgi:2-haloacid dehalogenase
MPAPALVIFDVNETLSDLEPLRPRLEGAGLPGSLLEVWFASTLRDGIAPAAAGGYADFRAVGLGVLAELGAAPADAEHVLAGLADLEVHPDVPEGMRRLAEAGVRMATLTNGAAANGARLLERAGLADLVERTPSVEAVGRWKPAPEPYLYAARECGLPPERCVVVAVHPWDVDGAIRAGLRGGWLDRRGRPYPGVFRAPDATGETLGALADALLAA